MTPANIPICQRIRSLLHLLIFLILSQPGLVWAGASSASWVVVVNGNSVNSRSLANHFCALRNIPFRNVVILKTLPDRDRVTVDEFRELILGPVLREIEARGLTPVIQGIVYSSDMPTSVSIQGDLTELKERSQYLTPVASINGLTYMFRWVQAKNPAYIGFDSNWYAAREGSSLLNVVTGSPEVRQQLQEWIENGQHEKAAEEFERLRTALGNPFPSDFLAARQWALAGNKDKAIERLSLSIRNGWRYRREITNDPAFDSLSEDPKFKQVVARCPNDDFRYLSTRGFDARTFYAPNTLEATKPEQGMSYMLSMVLSVTRDQGITHPEAVAHLQRSALADYSRPNGSFYFAKTSDVRTTTREPTFALAVEKLKALRMDARVINYQLPPFGSRTSGVMFGMAEYDWSRTGSRLMPGSIAESLTSFGGAMTTDSQTKGTELLRFGAAASSGAVTEPYAIQSKFPNPMMHVHYAEGLTCAEAFYESLLCPYQLLIFGDPLCQPFAEPPRFRISGVDNRQRVTGDLEMTLTATEDENTVDPVHLMWMVDGAPKTETVFQNKIRIQVGKNDRGAQEWRLIAKGPKPLENRFEQSVWVSLGDAESEITLKASEAWSTDEGDKVPFEIVNAPEGKTIGLRHDWEIIAKQPAASPKFLIDPDWLGYGPVRLQGVVLDDDGKVTLASQPVTIVLTKSATRD